MHKHDFDDELFLGPEALSSLHFESRWGFNEADAIEDEEGSALSSPDEDAADFDALNESLADLECAEALHRTHTTLLRNFD